MKRNFGFDIARSFSMIYIVAILHLSGYTDLAISQNNAFVSLIWSTLGVFTFLSSFLLSSRYSFKDSNDICIFYKKRVLRFYPLFLISSLLLLAIHFNTTAETLKGILGIAPFWKPQQHTLWYISMLIGLYMLTPLLCKKQLIYQITIFILILVSIGIIDFIFHSIDLRIYYYYIVYFVGILSAQYSSPKIVRIITSNTVLVISTVVYIVIFIIGLFNRIGGRLVMMVEGYLGIGVILNLCNYLGNSIEKQFKIISFLSYASMCAYLFHREVYWGLLFLYQPSNNWGTILYLFLIGVPIVFLISYNIQKYYDKVIKSF